MNEQTLPTDSILSCEKIFDKWASFGLEGLTILGFFILLIALIWIHKSERESWNEIILAFSDAMRKPNIQGSDNDDRRNGD